MTAIIIEHLLLKGLFIASAGTQLVETIVTPLLLIKTHPIATTYFKININDNMKSLNKKCKKEENNILNGKIPHYQFSNPSVQY